MTDLIREKYLSRIRPFYGDTDTIKVITGVRRCGKSTVMRQIIDEISSATPDSVIAYLDLDSKRYMDISTPGELVEAIDGILPSEGPGRYLFVDEVQNVEGFEKVVNAYRNDDVSVFVTGSNSYLLSGELVTKLTGRYIEFDVFPFSLSEVRDYKVLNGLPFDPDLDFRDYTVNGGFPKRFSYPGREEQETYVRSIVDEVIRKDVLSRNKVRGRASFQKVLGYILSTPSVTVSSTSVSGYLRSERIGVNPATVSRYLDMIFNSRLASRCLRRDIKGKKALRTLYKSYVADPALHTYYPSAGTGTRMGSLLENIVYNELRSRGYDVSAGKLGDGEVDFVVSRSRDVAYVQVTYVMDSPETEEREFAPLLRIRDAYPKYVISMDPLDMGRDGVKHLNLVRDFLLGDGFRLRRHGTTGLPPRDRTCVPGRGSASPES